MSDALRGLLRKVEGCQVCADHLPDSPRPVVQVGQGAGVVIIGQAPGRAVHQSGVPWDDPSGRRLRSWLGVDDREFYDASRFALIPMGFCYPGSGSSGDNPPRPECAPLWHDRLLEHVAPDHLLIVIGAHAMARYAPEAGRNVTEAVRRWSDLLPDRVVLPHPSPRNNRWLAANPWFEAETVPSLRRRVGDALLGDG